MPMRWAHWCFDALCSDSPPSFLAFPAFGALQIPWFTQAVEQQQAGWLDTGLSGGLLGPGSVQSRRGWVVPLPSHIQDFVMF